MIRVEGTGKHKVALVLTRLPWENPGPKPLQGRTGHAFSQMLLRRDLKRDDFWIVEVEGEDWAGMFETLKRLAPKVIVALTEPKTGNPWRVLTPNYEPIMKSRGYAEWAPSLNAWVMGSLAPSFLVKGNQNLSGVFLHDVEEAVRIAREGCVPLKTTAFSDPPPFVVEKWVQGYEKALAQDHEKTWLAYDIETPYKAEHEDEGDLEIDDPSFIILRISFAWQEGEALSIPWQVHYLPYIYRLLKSQGVKLGWNLRYDNPRLLANGVEVGGEIWDLMWAWHVINSDLPKGLSFVAPLLLPGIQRWKHLARNEPARYNAIDADITRRLGTILAHDLHTHHLWEAFYRHVVRLDVVLEGMTKVGVRVDDAARRTLSFQLIQDLDAFTSRMQSVVPLAGKRLKCYKGKPKGVSWEAGDPVPHGFVVQPGTRLTPFCPGCGAPSPLKPHFRTLKKPTLKRPQNPCAGLTPEVREIPCEVLARVEKFVPSNTQMLSYVNAMGHRGVASKGKSVSAWTFDDLALQELCKRYPADPLYPLVREYRDTEKLKGQYVGEWSEEEGRWVSGPPIGKDGRIHPVFTHAPSTLRLASQNPNSQNIDPRVKVLYVPDGAFLELDYKAIEAVIVGYQAGSERYVRLAKLGVHDFLNSHILARQGLIERPADPDWSDSDLKAFFKDLKARFKPQREVAKRCVHGGNYGMTPRHMSDIYPEYFPKPKDAAFIQGLYFEVCDEIPRWQKAVIQQANDSGYLVNPFGYVHRFWNVLTYTKERDGTWSSAWGEDAKRVLAFGPQSTAAGIIKEAMLAIWETEWRESLRLQVHDSLLFDLTPSRYEQGWQEVAGIMSRPVPCLPLPWSPGECLAIDVEAKVGGKGWSWGWLEEP